MLGHEDPAYSALRRPGVFCAASIVFWRGMSFLDNLENNLKSLESAEEGRETADRHALFLDERPAVTGSRNHKSGLKPDIT